MRARSVVSGLGFLLSLGFVACSAPNETSERSQSDLDALAAMAAPGVDETALNRMADPCADFYEFACGGYVASLPADTQRQIRSFTQLQQANNAVLAQVAQAIVQSPTNDAERNAAALFHSCMSTTTGAATTAFVTGFRAEIEAAHTPVEMAQLIARFHRRAVGVFFGFAATADSERVGRQGTAIAYAGGYKRATDYTNADQRNARIEKLKAAIGAVEPSVAADDVSRLATTAVTIEQSLQMAAAAGSAGSTGDEPTHPVGQAGLAVAAPHFDWNAYFTQLGRTDLGSFGVENLYSFSALDELLTTASIDDLHAYLTARWYESQAPTAPTQSGCMQQVESQMSDAIEPRFLALAGVDEVAQNKARLMFAAIVDAFGNELDKEPFLDVATLVEAKVKLMKMRGAIGGSRDLDAFQDVNLDPNASFAFNRIRLAERSFAQSLAQIGQPLPLFHVDFAAPTVNASYDGELNKINVPGGILGGYFFSASSPNLANFAALGSVLGHELTHGFDNNGRQLDGDGLVRDWWTPAVETKFNERAQCLVDEYSAFTLPGVTDPTTGETPAHINGKRTLGENIADNGGMKTAYRASGVDTLAGPVIAGFSPAQQFFVSYGQLWCGKTAPAVAGAALGRDSHSPEKARVNVPLQNFEAFARAFQCKSGTAMAPANRCGVW